MKRKEREIRWRILQSIHANSFYDRVRGERIVITPTASLQEGEVLYSRYSNYKNPIVKSLKPSSS